MKNYQYLTDGILESYLLGLVSDQQRQDVEQLLATDSELRAHLNELELEMEQHFLRHAVPPPPGVREAVLQRINESEIRKWEPIDETHTRREPVNPGPDKPNYIDVEVDNTHIRVHKYWRPAFIAVFILSKVFLILGLYYYFKADSQAQEIERLKAAVQQSAPLPRSSTP